MELKCLSKGDYIILNKARYLFHLIKTTNRKHAIQIVGDLFSKYGTKGVIRGVINKLSGRSLFYGISNHRDYDKIGREILQEQQEEFSLEEQKKQIASFHYLPLISVIMPIYNAPVKWLTIAIKSIEEQSYTNWELCIVDDGSKDPQGKYAVERLAQKDSRIRLEGMEENRGISAASNRALDMARGEFIALVDQDDELTPDAFFRFVKELNAFPQSDMLYSDECKTLDTVQPSPCDFYLKPDWSPELLMSHMYTGHLSMYRTALVKEIGAFRSKYDFSQDYDLALRVTEKTDKIRHIERILYYWRKLPSSGAAGGKDYARASNVAALGDALNRRGLNAFVWPGPYMNRFSIAFDKYPLISVVIPTDCTEQLESCVLGLIGEKTGYKNLEIIPVTNTKTAEEIQGLLPYVRNLRISLYNKPFNFSDKCNQGVQAARGEYVIIYNDDVTPDSHDWIERLLDVLQLPHVGAVSPLLHYEDGSVQYAGMITGVYGQVGTSFNAYPFKVPEGSAMNHFLMRNVSVLSGACLMARREVYLQVGGMDAVHTPNGHSDVDFSFKLLEHGYSCVYTPNAVLTHIGRHTWEAKDRKEKAEIFCIKRWGAQIANDLYFTKSMRRMLYCDVVEGYQMYYPEVPIVTNDNARDILFISHELTRTGAPTVLIEAVSASIDIGDYPVVVSPVDGPLRKTFLEMGVAVIIDPSVIYNAGWFEHFARNFDLIVANSVVCGRCVDALSNSLPPVLWWIHEGSYALDLFKDMIPTKIGRNIHLYCASEYTQRLLRLNDKNDQSDILQFGLKDEQRLFNSSNMEKGKAAFLCIGSLEARKGQDVLLNAIEKLSEEDRDKAEFSFIGRPLDKSIRSQIALYSQRFPCIHLYDIMPREDLLRLYGEATCVIVPSRDEPTSAVAVEGAMFNLPAIVSDKTGFSDFLTSGVNGFVFPSENADVLAEYISYVIRHPSEAAAVGAEARKVYDSNFTQELFRKRYLEIADQLMNM